MLTTPRLPRKFIDLIVVSVRSLLQERGNVAVGTVVVETFNDPVISDNQEAKDRIDLVVLSTCFDEFSAGVSRVGTVRLVRRDCKMKTWQWKHSEEQSENRDGQHRFCDQKNTS